MMSFTLWNTFKLSSKIQPFAKEHYFPSIPCAYPHVLYSPYPG